MAVQQRFNRNVRPIAPVDDEESFHTDSDEAGEANEADEAPSQNEAVGESEEDDASATSSLVDEEDVDQRLNAVSFGALKKANDTLSKKRKASDDDGPDREAKLESLKKRLQVIKTEKQEKRGPNATNKAKRSATAFATQSDSAEDQDSSSSEPEQQPTKTRAKHAPATQSSRRQVTRKRQVIEVPRAVARDPRFDAIRQAPASTATQEKAYAFLRDYQKSEMLELKAAMKKTKNQDDKDVLRRKFNAMDNRFKAREAKEREQTIISKHRKEEREKIKDGKTPYYLKRSDIKQKALVDKFDNMKSKDRERLMDRRRKKESQKEKRMMPELRRNVAS